LAGGISFKLQWTVFDGGARKNKLAQARANVHAAEAQANVTSNQIADEVWTAYSNLNTAFRQRQSALALLEAATESYSAALESYNYGVRSLLDVTAAQRVVAQARSADVLARTLRAHLARRVGFPNRGFDSTKQGEASSMNANGNRRLVTYVLALAPLLFYELRTSSRRGYLGIVFSRMAGLLGGSCSPRCCRPIRAVAIPHEF
jgi:hypothetical protein